MTLSLNVGMLGLQFRMLMRKDIGIVCRPNPTRDHDAGVMTANTRSVGPMPADDPSQPANG